MILDFDCNERQYNNIIAYNELLLVNNDTGETKLYRAVEGKNKPIKAGIYRNYPMYPKVKLFAHAQNLELKDIAKKIGCNYQGLCNALNGHCKLKEEYKDKIAEILGVSKGVLFGGKK